MSKIDNIQTVCDNCEYAPALDAQAVERIKALISELIPEGVDVSKYKTKDEESFMFGYVQACIEIQEKVNKL